MHDIVFCVAKVIENKKQYLCIAKKFIKWVEVYYKYFLFFRNISSHHQNGNDCVIKRFGSRKNRLRRRGQIFKIANA